jgi:hypothetical protein
MAVMAACVSAPRLGWATGAGSAIGVPEAAPTAAGAAAASREPPGQYPQRHAAALDYRISLLARELDLSPGQQEQVKGLLQAQQAQVAALWNDTALPAALRVGRTQALAERTAGQIRALLTDEQRKKYIQPRKRDVAVGASGANVEAWPSPGKAP